MAGITVWQWDVTPLRGGSHRLLTLCASMDVKPSKGTSPRRQAVPSSERFESRSTRSSRPGSSSAETGGGSWSPAGALLLSGP